MKGSTNTLAHCLSINAFSVSAYVGIRGMVVRMHGDLQNVFILSEISQYSAPLLPYRRLSVAPLSCCLVALISMAIRYRQGDRKQACSVEPLSRKCQNPSLVKDSRGSAGRLLSATPGQVWPLYLSVTTFLKTPSQLSMGYDTANCFSRDD